MSDVDFFGQSFALNPATDYEWEMMEFASAASGGADGNLLSGAAAVMDLLKAAIVAADWPRFRQAARENRAQVERDLMPIVVQVFTQQAERPTRQPSGSSGGHKKTKRKSEGGSSSRVVRRLEKEGRPDLALMVTMAEEGRSAVSA